VRATFVGPIGGNSDGTILFGESARVFTSQQDLDAWKAANPEFCIHYEGKKELFAVIYHFCGKAIEEKKQ
jgi:hypothetical protein